MNDAHSTVTPHIAGYEITRRLGRGGMADVYLAMQVSLSRPVAIKVLSGASTSGEEGVTRFEQEARTIARLDHPNIVSIFDVGRTAEGQLYYVMPYLPNGDLSTRDLRDNEAEIVAIVRALARALGYAHKLGVVHRDVKPENVLFDKLNRPLLADFGIALASSNFARVTREGSTIGSSGYMSPEQARGLPTDGRADLYSLGVVAYEMLSGDLPYHGPDTLSVALAHVEQPIPRLPPRRRRWQPFIDKAMAKSPDERFQNAEQMETALDRIAKEFGDTPDAAYATKALPALAERPKRNVVGLAALAFMALAGAALIGYAVMRMRHDATAPSSSTIEATPSDAPGATGNDAGQSTEPATANADAKPSPPAPDAAPAAASGENAAASAEGAAPTDAAGAAAVPDANATAPAPPPKKAPKAAPKPAPPKPRTVADLAAGAALRDKGGPELVVVTAPAGSGGSSADAARFALGRNEVTRREYAEFAEATGRPAAKCREPHSPLSALRKLNWREPGFAQDDTHPVVCVSWDDANAYAEWLGTRLQARYRLPTRAEWLSAYRAPAADQPPCEQGNRADASSSHRKDACDDGFAFTAPVGRFKPNSLGVNDMIGNVSVWTTDCKGSKTPPCSERMFSGGSWRDDASADNTQDDAGTDTGYTTIGIRVVRELSDDNIPK